jgi:hypothetical protein
MRNHKWIQLTNLSPYVVLLSIEETREQIKNVTEYKDGIILDNFSLACFTDLRPNEIHRGGFRLLVSADPLRWSWSLNDNPRPALRDGLLLMTTISFLKYFSINAIALVMN